MHAITRRVGTTVAIVLAVVLGTATRAAAVEPEWAEGQWIGGFEGVDGTVYVSAQVEDRGRGGLTGSLELPLQGDGAVRLEKVKATADALQFDVRGVARPAWPSTAGAASRPHHRHRPPGPRRRQLRAAQGRDAACRRASMPLPAPTSSSPATTSSSPDRRAA